MLVEPRSDRRWIVPGDALAAIAVALRRLSEAHVLGATLYAQHPEPDHRFITVMEALGQHIETIQQVMLAVVAEQPDEHPQEVKTHGSA